VNIEVEGEDEPAWFDPHLLGRVLRHLLENAAVYAARGPHHAEQPARRRPAGVRVRTTVRASMRSICR
jgi:signal transduction histidine kinase